MELIITRHGETPWNTEKKIQGILDTEMNDTGFNQSQQLALSLKNHDIDAIYTSPLKRAYHTAELINQYHDVPIYIMPGLMELYPGDFQGLPLYELVMYEKKFLNEWIADPVSARFPGGEHFIGAQDRAWGVIEDIAGKNENAVIVSHYFVIAAILCKIKNVHLSEFRSVGVSTASKTLVRWSMEGHARIEQFNDLSHLMG